MKILISGPCSSGKTSTLNELRKLGYKTTDEHARQLLKKGLRGDEFELAVLKKRIEIYESVKNEKIVFFDRSFLDSVTYLKFDRKSIKKEFVDAVKKYRFDKVFVLEPLDKYEPDGLRELFVKDKKEAERWFKLMLETCKEYSYKAIIVKKRPLKERVDFILKNI